VTSSAAPLVRQVHERDPLQVAGRLVAWSAGLGVLAPIPLVFIVATSRSWPQGAWAGGFTLQWLASALERIAPHAIYSLQLAALVMVINLVIGLPTAWALARYRFPGREILLSLSALPLAIPGIAVALGLILAYPTARGGGTLLLIGHVLYTLPFFLGALVPVLNTERLLAQEEVAKSLSAAPTARFLFVTLPNVRRALIAAAIMVVTLSMGEFNVSFFLITPLDKTLPIELYDAYVTGRVEVAAGMTMWFLAFVIPASVVLERFGGGGVGQA
jgi:putative spermidine/putrescine transport system permease protein